MAEFGIGPSVLRKEGDRFPRGSSSVLGRLPSRRHARGRIRAKPRRTRASAGDQHPARFRADKAIDIHVEILKQFQGGSPATRDAPSVWRGSWHALGFVPSFPEHGLGYIDPQLAEVTRESVDEDCGAGYDFELIFSARGGGWAWIV